VLAYRAIAIWLPAPIGLAALNGLRRTTATWTAEDAPADAPAPAHRETVRTLPVRPLREPAMQAAA
jgi:hypothetical protein